MTTLGEELKKIRKRDGLTFAQIAERFDVSISSYNNVERGVSSAQSPTARRILLSRALPQEDRRHLQEIAQGERSKKHRIEITDADRLAYQRRKNEQYEQAMKLPRKVRNKGIKKGYSKTSVQRIFY